ncbi:outer membrane protein assembly factor BamB family protein [Roseimarinus sediminis]|jgi:outer membrane protein assembly factor BamB|uniref:outer membrane protein assembly factor BamB family protein n=1 Tax=Roseimarinus sediminis TaxID=1610899 RepID=UPI003D22B001
MRTLFILFIFICSNDLSWAGEQNRWRGPHGNGIYEAGNLLEKWPDEGPTEVMMVEGLGEGFTSPAFIGNKMYITGMIDSLGYLFVMTDNGEILDKIAYGPEYTLRYVGTRSTPKVVGDLIYLLTGEGNMVCISERQRKIVWSKHISDFGGENLRFGIAESLVVDGDVLYASPGGPEYNVLALNRHNGDLVWSCPAKGTTAAYCTPLLFEHKGRKVLATMMADWLLGIDAEDGRLLWSHPYEKRRSNFPNTPIYHEGEIYYFSGYDNGGVKLSISENAESVDLLWESDSLQSKMGGAVLLDGYLYGSGDTRRQWYCLDWKTGETVATYNGLANGVVIAADNKLFLYTDRGEVVLMRPDPNHFEVISQFRIQKGTAQHWAHPVIHDGKLYVRHGDVLLAYQIK